MLSLARGHAPRQATVINATNRKIKMNNWINNFYYLTLGTESYITYENIAKDFTNVVLIVDR